MKVLPLSCIFAYTNLITHEFLYSSSSLLNESLLHDKLWGPSQRVVTLFHIPHSYQIVVPPLFSRLPSAATLMRQSLLTGLLCQVYNYCPANCVNGYWVRHKSKAWWRRPSLGNPFKHAGNSSQLRRRPCCLLRPLHRSR